MTTEIFEPGRQYDLFGEDLAAQDRARELERQRQAELDEWQSRFERADWIAPWDCADGTPKGAAKRGWRCPDPACRKVEPNAYLLSINHGFDPTVPGDASADGRCFSVRRAARTGGGSR